MSDTIVRAATHGKGRTALNRALNARQSFRTSGALKGDRVAVCELRFNSGGELRGADLDRWKADRETVTYVVWSYATPIGWVVADGTERGRFYRVSQKFSVTTSKHQGTLWAVEQPAGYFDGRF
jgi:hypothetical protein